MVAVNEGLPLLSRFWLLVRGRHSRDNGNFCNGFDCGLDGSTITGTFNHDGTTITGKRIDAPREGAGNAVAPGQTAVNTDGENGGS
jgi:hypothetical protein